MEQKIAAEIQNIFGVETEVKFSRPDPKFGDYATNVALQLAKPLGQQPREIAEKLADSLRAGGDFTEVSVAGPGFINMRLSDDRLLEMSQQMTKPSRQGETIVIETNNPNPFKAMHIGHAFNAVIADTLANLIEASGASTYRVSYHGDVGLHVGKSMYSLLKYADGDINKITSIPENERNTFMSRMYAEGAAAYKENEAAKAEIDNLAKQSFEPKSGLYVQIYDLCKSWSFQAIDDVVSRLGNKPIERRFLESDADMRGVETVKKNVPEVFQESNGALVFEGSKYGAFDNVFVASNGRGVYAARDLGLMQLKNEYFHAQKSYIVTAEEQRDYFKGVIAAAELSLPELKGVTVNITTGTVKLTTGKMSSRDGNVVEITWLFDQVAEAIKSRGGEPTDEIIAGALRYQFLKIKIGSDVIFDINESVSLTGNTGSYLQYAHARAASILNKSTKLSIKPDMLDSAERSLVLKISEYNEVVCDAMNELAPHTVCTYLYELAQEFNRFYEKSRIIDDPREGERLYVTQLYKVNLARGLALLGIHALDSM